MILFSSVDAVFHLWNAIPNSSKTECQTFACLVSNESGQWYTVIRITVCIANMLVGIALICLVKIKTVSKSAILKFWGFGVSKYVGPYSLLVTTINSSFCGFVYFKVMKKSIKKSSIHASIAPVMLATE
uniref:Uncharacterized protein n=1 Tax=Panagrolaimus superbus TaxID=310955 RepID=A0A914YXT1_9BILA